MRGLTGAGGKVSAEGGMRRVVGLLAFCLVLAGLRLKLQVQHQ